MYCPFNLLRLFKDDDRRSNTYFIIGSEVKSGKLSGGWSGERRVGDGEGGGGGGGEWRVEAGGWWLVAGGWWVEAGGWRLVGGDRWVVTGGWCVVRGGPVAKREAIIPLPPHPTHTRSGVIRS